MPKNIIVCFDGTGNQFGERNSNVVNLYRVLRRDMQSQIAYYDPGVGTMSDPEVKAPLARKISKYFGLAFGYGLETNIFEAYSYLMDNYQPKDKIFLFGFSRGAYTARVLAGFIRMSGLLEKGCQNLIPYAYRLFKNANFKVAAQFKATYARRCPIEFLGVWDTVSSVGWIGKRRTFPYTAANPDVKTVRHAVSIDERRAYYRQNLWNEEKSPNSDVRQVWFAGVHSDVGGSYPEAESGLSKIALNWMITEAVDHGLEIDRKRYHRFVLGQDKKGEYTGPDWKTPVHKSLKGLWWLLEFWPKNYTLEHTRYFIPRGLPRIIAEDSLVHRSVLDKIQHGGYQPENLPVLYRIEASRQLE